MNILFFLTPKSEVAYITEDMTLRQALEKMENHRFTCIPVLGADGRYVGSITEGDLLWAIKNQYNLNLREAEKLPITDVRRKRDYMPVYVNETVEGMFNLAMSQNFVPVVDDRRMFIGIITRKDILQYCYKTWMAQDVREDKAAESER
ncbi:MAG: CBS domain-containing protein [Lachnospiraceae bacterium]|nr:CBS domain-containing protein [Lachnospiraceae bacterium]